MEWLFWIFGTLVVITLVGHGIWVLFAHVFGGSRRKKSVAMTEAVLGDLLRSRRIDEATYRRVIDALGTSGRRAMRPPPLPPRWVLPVEAMPVGSVAVEPVTVEPVSDESIAIASPESANSLQQALRVEAAAVAVAPLPDPYPYPVPPAPPFAPTPSPRKPSRPAFSLAGFLRESNIRWGELVGGLLIVGCSVALVVSFWSQISSRPFFQFGVFTAVSAAVLGLGLHAEHRWRLPTTSRGLLLIATLLVPLDFLAYAAVSRDAGGSAAMALVEAAALGLFGFLLWRAATVLAPQWPAALAGPVVAYSAFLAAARLAGHVEGPGVRQILAGFPVGVEFVAAGWVSWKARRWRLHRAAGEAILLLAGVSVFGAALCLGLVVVRNGKVLETCRLVSPWIALATLPPLAAGLTLHRRTDGPKLAALRTAGTAVALLAAGATLGSVALAWPAVGPLIQLACGTFAVLLAAAIAFDLPALELGAAGAALLAYVLILGTFRGHLHWADRDAAKLIAALRWPGNGLPLLPLAALYAGAAALFRRVGRVADSRYFAGSAAGVAAVGIAIASWGGFGVRADPFGVAWLYLIDAATAMALAIRRRDRRIGLAGWFLASAATVQACLTHGHVAMPWSSGLLAAAVCATAVVIVRRFRSGDRIDAIADPAAWVALAASGAATALLLASLRLDVSLAAAGRLMVAAAVFVVAGIARRSAATFVWGELLLVVATAAAAVAVVARQAWFRQSHDPLLEPFTIQAVLASLAGLAIVASVVQALARPVWTVKRWLSTPYAVHRVLTGVLLAGIAMMAVAAAAAGVEVELGRWGIRELPTWQPAAAGFGSWVALCLIAVAIAVQLWGGIGRDASFLGFVFAGAIACPLLAAQRPEHAGSLLRESLSVYGFAAAVPLWFRVLPANLARGARWLLVLITAGPVALLSLVAVMYAIDVDAHALPVSTLSILLPLALVSATLSGHGVRERSPAWAFSGAIGFAAAVTLASLVALVAAGTTLDPASAVRILWLNVLTLGAYAIGWSLVRDLFARVASVRHEPDSLLRVLVWMSGGLASGVLSAAAMLFLLLGTPSGPFVRAFGSPIGWLAFAAASVAGWRVIRAAGRPVTGRPAAALLFGLVVMGACSARGVATDPWFQFHLLTAGMVAASAALLGAGFWLNPRVQPPASVFTDAIPVAANPGTLGYALSAGRRTLTRRDVRWLGVLSIVAVLFALRGALNDPAAQWWSVAPAACLALIWALAAVGADNGRLLYTFGLLLNVATLLWCGQFGWPFAAARLPLTLSAFAAANALAGLAGWVMGGEALRHPFAVRSTFHRTAANAATLIVAGLTFVVLDDASWVRPAGEPLAHWGALLAAFALAAVTHLSDSDRRALARVYALGLSAAVLACGELRPSGEWLFYAVGIATGAFVIVSSVLWSMRLRLIAFASRLGLRSTAGLVNAGLVNADAGHWLMPTNLVLAACVIAIAFWVDLNFISVSVRLAAAAVALLQAPALAMGARGDGRQSLREVTLLLATAAGASLAWALPPAGHRVLLDRMAVTLAAVTVSAAAGQLAKRFPIDALWRSACAKVTLVLLAIGAGGLFAAIGVEVVQYFTRRAVEIHPAAVAGILAALLAGSAMAVAFALRAGVARRADPAVYAAEACLALAFVHLRVCEPWVFGGVLARYWPLIFVAIAFAGVGAGKALDRTRAAALSPPLFRTGVFLPLLPVLAFWAAPSAVPLSGLLFAIACLYAAVSVARKSYGFAALAALAANGGFWAVLAHAPQLAFFRHPQLWCIPAAVCVLAAAQLNASRLPPAQLRLIRYAALLVVYVSSTADLFLAGVRQAPWLPLVLALLSVAGVMIGVALRIRPFLFLGTAFLALAILTMIQYASADLGWTWLWYVAGIALGAAIISVFALFERKREQMMAVVEGLRTWE